LNPPWLAPCRVRRPGAHFRRPPLPADPRRGGLLGQAAFLTATTGPAQTSPTARGLFVRENLLCQHVPPPPAGVNTQLPEQVLTVQRTKTKLMQDHVDNPVCASCHRMMDPIEFGIEGYVAFGRLRE